MQTQTTMIEKEHFQLRENENLISAQTLKQALLALKNGANINATHYLAPLQGNLDHFIQIWQGRLEIVQYLAQNGARIRPKDQYLSMPLICAAWFGNLELVKLFIKKGIWLHGGDQHGNTALYYAENRAHTHIANYLKFKGAHKLHNTDFGPITPDQKNHSLLIASRFRDLAQVKTMIRLGANVNTIDQQGNTPLIWAARDHHTEIVRTLLLQGANPNYKTPKGMSALIHAGSHLSNVKLLLLAGANPNIQDQDHKTSLTHATIKECFRLAKLLITAGASPYIKDKKGYSSLDYAKKQANTPMMTLLKKAGTK